MAFALWRLSKVPNERTRKKVEAALQAKGLALVDVGCELDGSLGRQSQVILVAQAKDAFGNDRKQYFRVEVLSDMLGLNARIREIPSPKGAMRAFDSPV
jgi:hypothetical protein